MLGNNNHKLYTLMLKAKKHIWYVQQIKMFTPDEITIAKASILPLASTKEKTVKISDVVCPDR